jgi:hypothetical protein
MGQTNDSENPELILEKLKTLSIQDENKASLDTSFNTIRKILTDYKFYKDILSNNTRKSFSPFNHGQFGTIHEYTKHELINFQGNYNKNVFQDINHKIERIKKWVNMAQSSDINNNDNNLSFQSMEDNKAKIIKNDNSLIKNFKNMKSSTNIKRFKKLTSQNFKSTSSKKNGITLSNYTDKKIENGITEFYVIQNSKFIERIRKGPPDCFRWSSWCIINNLPIDRNNTIYENYTNMSLEKENKDRIIRDIERTFSERQIDKKELRKMERSLYRVLKAFWNIDKVVGYCQGMNLLVGFLLILSDFNERDTFYILISNFSQTFKSRKKYEYNFRGLFSEEFPLLHFLNYIFDCLLNLYAHELKNHLDKMDMPLDLWMGKWFQTVFTIILPINWCQRLWDNIFAENIFFMVKFGIAFTLMIKDDLMKMGEEIEILNYFKEFEKSSLGEENELLNSKGDINSIILKAKKIKIDVESYLKNYEKNNELGKDFYIKMEKIEDVIYHFRDKFVPKPTIQSVLFSDEENIINNNKDSNNKQIIDKKDSLFNSLSPKNSVEKKNSKENSKENISKKNNKEIDNVINIRKNNRIKNLKCAYSKLYSKKKTSGNNERKRSRLFSFDLSSLSRGNLTNECLMEKGKKNNSNKGSKNHKKQTKENKMINNINVMKNYNNEEDIDKKSNQNNIIEISNYNTIDRKESNNNNNNNQNNNNINLVNVTEESSINSTYYQNVEENILIENGNQNIIKNYLESHQFEKFLNKNKLDFLTIKNALLKTGTKDSDLNLSPTKEKKESMGIHFPEGNDISSFVGKNKFRKKENRNNSNGYINNPFFNRFGNFFDKEKISKWC